MVLLKYLSWGFFFYLFVFVCRKRSWWSRSEVLMPHSEETENATNLSHREERGWSKHRSAWLPKFSAVQHRWSRLTLLIQLCILLGVNQHNLQFYLQFDKESTLENKMLKTKYVCLTGSCDGGKQMDTTCESSQGENVNLRDKTEEDGDNADLDNSAVGWDIETLLCHKLPLLHKTL